ncbi:MAG TPA: FAD-dependent oxidoreductase [Gammaproteobacteria bacterium]|jgi:3-phenylpropionate/trans-cinnamate dioxygenase ferredoxin reductase subunit|nr:pyridine nucleotide-disulfide oxidoreductase [Chromatiales bacterium]MCP4926767.1 FAD-dependent oxidoreductase [Gammaproteobacteria bacterium]MDP7153802.1 FAD-dependent oxidoreductase [Gammaproteobacteria bacterium]MDP7295944.1 FAD-dependent oxidoreductase [Gammaproteobacteria bacterium]MDP7660928.1 FAD-dependent oxidoreductase [Gammaproteobacteria bacterium]
MPNSIVIAGAGHAAGQAVVSLRQGGFSGRIIMVGEEPYLPYQRPPLSKKYLSGELELERMYVRHNKFYAEHDIDIRLSTRVEEINRKDQLVVLSNGQQESYDRLVLATGSHVRKLQIPGHDLEGIHYLRAIEDVHKIQDRFKPGARLVIIGAGYIGMETAAVAVTHGLDTTVVETADRIMARALAPEVSAFFDQVHRDAGVKILCGRDPNAEILGNGKVEALRGADGMELPADLIIAGIGILPTVDIAEQAGIECENGILVDEFCRTSDPNIMAIGDCTNHPNQLLNKRLRLESVHNAQEQAKTAAATLCGKLRTYNQIPWFWSDQYDLKLQIVGLSGEHDEVIIRGDFAERSFAAFYMQEDLLIAVDAVNSAREFMLSKKLIANGARLEPEILADKSIDFKDLAKAALS